MYVSIYEFTITPHMSLSAMHNGITIVIIFLTVRMYNFECDNYIYIYVCFSDLIYEFNNTLKYR